MLDIDQGTSTHCNVIKPSCGWLIGSGIHSKSTRSLYVRPIRVVLVMVLSTELFDSGERIREVGRLEQQLTSTSCGMV